MSVNRILFLLLVAGITFLVVLLLARPDLLENVWMWLVGLSGSIVKAGQGFVQFCQKTFGDKKQPQENVQSTTSNAANSVASTTSAASNISTETQTNNQQNQETMNDEAQWDLYPNFSKKEFDCKETEKNEMKHSFMEKLQQLRTAYGKPMRITSGFRDYTHTAERNKPKKNGSHPTGQAADIGIARGDAYLVLKLAMEMGFTGIGVKQHGDGRFLHVDTIANNADQPRPTIWSYK